MRYVLATINKVDVQDIFDGERTSLIRTIEVDVPLKVFMYEPIGENNGAGKVVGEFLVNSYWALGNRKFAWDISDLCRYAIPRPLSDFELKRPPLSVQYIAKAVIKRNNL